MGSPHVLAEVVLVGYETHVGVDIFLGGVI